MGDQALQALAIIEKDRNGDVMWTWLFPEVKQETRDAVSTMLDFSDENTQRTDSFGRVKDIWYFLSTTPSTSAALPDVASYAIVSFSKTFNPEQYYAFNSVCIEDYAKDGNASTLVSLFLAAQVRGSIGKRFAVASFDVRKAYLTSSLKDVINAFGLESILIFTAMLLKKRIAVFSSDKQALLTFVRTVPQFVFARLNWDVAYPVVQLSDTDAVAQLGPHYVAGFLSNDIEGREDLYDIFVNLPAASITIASQAQDAFALGKIHKEIAMFMKGAAEDDSVSNLDLVKELVSRTQDIIGGLKKLADPDTGKVQLSSIRERKMQPSMITFLCNLASAENMVAL